MTFKAGISGNPSGVKREQKFRETLERALKQDTSGRLRKAAEALLDNAAAGEPWALNMLADRLDGKADQVVTFKRDISDMSREEILDRLTIIGRATATATVLDSDGSEREPVQFHQLS